MRKHPDRREPRVPRVRKDGVDVPAAGDRGPARLRARDRIRRIARSRLDHLPKIETDGCEVNNSDESASGRVATQRRVVILLTYA